ncbi:Spermine/spermidine acetyltransferase (plasmid) [Burkholderia sp. AD24]|nr:Spermine/spermidine acetyltransferase [Burkholderia sp. AD24]
MEWRDGDLYVTTNVDELDFSMIHQYLSEVAYWSRGVTREKVERAVRHSLAFGLFQRGKQVGFARMITDATTFAYLSDVFVLTGHQGQGLGKWLMQCIFSHLDLQGLRRIMLLTDDAHGLYEKFGFRSPANPEMIMEKK